MIDHQILEALQIMVTEAVEASIMSSLPISFTSVAFIQPDDQKYLETVFITNNEDNGFWGDEMNYRGMFRLILHWPKDGSGAQHPMQVLSSIAGYYTKGRLLDGVQITSSPNMVSPIADTDDMIYPLSVRYTRFATV